MTIDCVGHIKKMSTAGLHKARRYDNGKGFQYLDLNSVLEIKEIKWFTEYQHFAFETELSKPRWLLILTVCKRLVTTRRATHFRHIAKSLTEQNVAPVSFLKITNHLPLYSGTINSPRPGLLGI